MPKYNITAIIECYLYTQKLFINHKGRIKDSIWEFSPFRNLPSYHMKALILRLIPDINFRDKTQEYDFVNSIYTNYAPVFEKSNPLALLRILEYESHIEDKVKFRKEIESMINEVLMQMSLFLHLPFRILLSVIQNIENKEIIAGVWQNGLKLDNLEGYVAGQDYNIPMDKVIQDKMAKLNSLLGWKYREQYQEKINEEFYDLQWCLELYRVSLRLKNRERLSPYWTIFTILSKEYCEREFDKSNLNSIRKELTDKISKESLKYIDKIIDYCKGRDISLRLQVEKLFSSYGLIEDFKKIEKSWAFRSMWEHKRKLPSDVDIEIEIKNLKESIENLLDKIIDRKFKEIETKINDFKKEH